MSRVYLIAADKPLPLCNKQAERTSTTMVGQTPYSISFVRGFRVAEHRYYRHAVDILHYPIKHYQYELALERHGDDLAHLKQYLAENFSVGETVELWNIWVGDYEGKRLPPRYQGKAAEFDIETLEQFLRPDTAGNPGQCCLTILI